MTPSDPDNPRSDGSLGDSASAAGNSFPTAGERTAAGGLGAWLDHWGLRETRMWWLTAACAVVALVLVATAWHSSGLSVTIEFVEGHGLQPGDAVRLRGIDVGTVEHVVLNPALDRVQVTVQLMREASAIAREGTLFWIVNGARIGQHLAGRRRSAEACSAQKERQGSLRPLPF